MDSATPRLYASAVTPAEAHSAHEGLGVHTVGAARFLVLQRPERRNALTPDLARTLATEVDAAARDTAVRTVFLRGAGGHFSVGLDLKWYTTLGERLSGGDLATGLAAFQDLVRAIVAARVPVVAVLEGSVAGFGLDLALACDLRIASDTLAVSSAFAAMGLVPDGGSTYTLPQLAGTGNALDLLLAGATLDATRAREVGLVSAVHPADRLEAAIEQLAQRLSAAAPSSLEPIKRLVRAEELAALERHLKAEAHAQLAALRSDEFRDRLQKFRQRRGER